MSLDVNYPLVTTYYIANTGTVYSYGPIDTDQCLSTGLSNLQTFTVEADYLAALTQLGISLTDNS